MDKCLNNPLLESIHMASHSQEDRPLDPEIQALRSQLSMYMDE
jgi:hypothetical protein